MGQHLAREPSLRGSRREGAPGSMRSPWERTQPSRKVGFQLMPFSANGYQGVNDVLRTWGALGSHPWGRQVNSFGKWRVIQVFGLRRLHGHRGFEMI